MLFSIDHESPRPVFRQIVDEVQRCIAIGVLRADEPLPAIRSLAVELGVNPNTVQHAYRTLEQEGIVYVKRGQGTYIAARREENRQVLARKAREIAARALRDAYRHGLLASDILAALGELAPRREGQSRASGARGEQEVRRD